jgi:hypothetical protein
MEVVEDMCSCGEKISVQINCTQRVSRTDKKRPFYPDAKLPDAVDPEKYSIENVSVFRCRKCRQPVSESVPAASYESE